MERVLFVLSGVLGFLAVGLGAFGAHGLRTFLENLPDGAKRMEWWQTAAHYHLVHALAIGMAGYLAARVPTGFGNAAGFCFVGGILLFSGSLYVMTATGIRALGAVTPFGGLLMLAGWALVAATAIRIST